MDYRFDERSYQALEAAGVGWRTALHVLTIAKPKLMRHIGSVLQVVAAAPPSGQLLSVALIEESDDHYVVVGVRWLDPDEVELLSKYMERGSQ